MTRSADRVPGHQGAGPRFEATPDWAEWRGLGAGRGYTLGVEEEVMLLRPGSWALAFAADRVLPDLPPDMAAQATAEMHGAALELATGVHTTVAGASDELRSLRLRLESQLAGAGLRAASAGTHPFAVWQDTELSKGKRYEVLYGSIRELARREPTFGLHVHVGVPDAEDAMRLVTRLRGHLPLFLALSANSPFWQGRDTGLASARTPLFQAFPRVGIPRAFASYEEWVEAVGMLIRCGAIDEPTFLWWDVRPQPRFGTIEVRIMDAQTTVESTAALVALVQCVARLELEEGYARPALLAIPEVLDENRFLAARDGMRAELIDPDLERRVPVKDQLAALVAACRGHAQELGCEAELERTLDLVAESASERQVETARGADRLQGLVAALSARFGERCER